VLRWLKISLHIPIPTLFMVMHMRYSTRGRGMTQDSALHSSAFRSTLGLNTKQESCHLESSNADQALHHADVVKRHLRDRFWSTVDYLSIVIQIFVVYSVAVFLDLLVAKVFKTIIQDAVVSYPLVKNAFEWFEIGLAFLGMVLALVHSIVSVYSHIRFEFTMLREEIPPDAGS
jgi:hypothetical protein